MAYAMKEGVARIAISQRALGARVLFVAVDALEFYSLSTNALLLKPASEIRVH